MRRGYVRFMDWQATNHSPLQTWAQRPLQSRVTYADERGVALEDCIDAANALSTNGWFCIPHLADDNFVRQMATLIRDRLSSTAMCLIEFSNEVWNGGFGQYGWARDASLAAWGASDEFTRIANWYAKRATECFVIFDQVFASQPGRLRKVLGGQTGTGSYWIGQTLTGDLWKAREPASWVDPASVADHVAITSYFGHGLIRNATVMSQAAAAADPSLFIYNHLVANVLPGLRAGMIEDSNKAEESGLSLLMYEGGTHMQDSGSGTAAQQKMLRDFQNSTYSAEVHEYLWNVWRNDLNSGGPFSTFADVSPANQWGDWGLAEYLGQPDRPFHARLKQLAASTPKWWTPP